MYALMVAMGILCLIPSLISRDWAIGFVHTYCAAAIWMLRVIVGTRVEVRGDVPTGPCIVAAKHQSFLDIIVLARVLPRPSFVMKKSLRWAPVVGLYAERLGSIAIDRSAGRVAVQTMLDGAIRQAAGRQIIIFPQGTRVAPTVDVPYRPGVVRLYEQLGVPVVLAALNTGWFWPRHGIRRTPGLVVVEFLETIGPGEPTKKMLGQIAKTIETASDRLADDAVEELRQTGRLD